ncbi:hypothetical protein P7C70_g9555, partial [Phenoliferia sp. Uapishka_3]
ATSNNPATSRVGAPASTTTQPTATSGNQPAVTPTSNMRTVIQPTASTSNTPNQHTAAPTPQNQGSSNASTSSNSESSAAPPVADTVQTPEDPLVTYWIPFPLKRSLAYVSFNVAFATGFAGVPSTGETLTGQPSRTTTAVRTSRASTASLSVYSYFTCFSVYTNALKAQAFMIVGKVYNNKLVRDDYNGSKVDAWMIDIEKPASVATDFDSVLKTFKMQIRKKAKNPNLNFAGNEFGVRLARYYKDFPEDEVFPEVYDCSAATPATLNYSPRMAASAIQLGSIVACTGFAKLWIYGNNSGVRIELNSVR